LRLAANIWTRSGAISPELLQYRLAKEFGWTVQEIKATPWLELQGILAAMDMENRAARARQQSEQRRRH